MLHSRRLGLVLVFAALSANCQQAPPSLLGPSARGGATLNLDASADGTQWGSLGHGIMHSAANDSGFTCALGPFGIAEQSHATISNSGNETVTCSGQTAAAPDRAERLEGFQCALHFGDGDPLTPDVTFDSRAVITPSGHITLVCKG